MKFKSRHDYFFSLVIIGLNVFLIVIAIYGLIFGEIGPNEYWISALLLTVVAFVFWIFFGTNYELNQTKLFYKSGPFKGSINLDRIKKIEVGKTMWVGFRPATARNGLIVHYNKFDEVYITPKTNQSFIQKILELDNTIKIVPESYREKL